MWYYVDGTNQQQKATGAELRQLIAQGIVGKDTLVWTQGMSEWQPAIAAIPNLFQPAAAAAPPPPPTDKRQRDRRTDEIDYEIFGDDMQIVEIELDPTKL